MAITILLFLALLHTYPSIHFSTHPSILLIFLDTFQMQASFNSPKIHQHACNYLESDICLHFFFWFEIYMQWNVQIFKKLINLFLAALGLCCCTRAFSSCGKRELLFVVVLGLLIAVYALYFNELRTGIWCSLSILKVIQCTYPGGSVGSGNIRSPRTKKHWFQ